MRARFSDYFFRSNTPPDSKSDLSFESDQRASEEALNGESSLATNASQPASVWLKIGTLALLFLTVAAIWEFTPISEFASPSKLFGWMRSFAKAHSFAFFVFAGLIAVGNLLLIPINLLLIGVALVFPGWKGFWCGMLGAVMASLLQARIGAWLGAARVQKNFGGRFDTMLKVVTSEIRSHALRTVILLGLVPIAPNIMLNMIYGICRIPAWKLVLGTMVAFLPGLVLLNLLGREMRRFVQEPSVGALLTGLGLVGLIVLIVSITRRLKIRFEAQYRDLEKS